MSRLALRVRRAIENDCAEAFPSASVVVPSVPPPPSSSVPAVPSSAFVVVIMDAELPVASSGFTVLSVLSSALVVVIMDAELPVASSGFTVLFSVRKEMEQNTIDPGKKMNKIVTLLTFVGIGLFMISE